MVGDLMLDRYWWGSVNRISPEAPVPVVSKTRESLALGGAANVASNLKGIGAEPLVIGIVGTDSAGELLKSRMGAAGLSCDGIVSTAQRPTTVKTRVIAHNQQIVRVDEEDVSAASGVLLDELLKLLPQAVADSDAVLLSDYAKGCLSPEILSLVFAAAAKAGRKVIVDPKGKDYSRYSGAYLLTPNQKETIEATGILETSSSALQAAGRGLVSDLRLGALLITRGEHGMMLLEDAKEAFELPASARDVYDVTGAGDTVISVLTASVAAGFDLRHSATVANMAAGIVVEHVGTTAITRELLLSQK